MSVPYTPPMPMSEDDRQRLRDAEARVRAAKVEGPAALDARDEIVREFFGRGVSATEIAREMEHDRSLVYQIVRQEPRQKRGWS